MTSIIRERLKYDSSKLQLDDRAADLWHLNGGSLKNVLLRVTASFFSPKVFFF